MTEGKALLILLLLFIVWLVLSEAIFRYKRHKLKKESNLSDYGIKQALDRDCVYFSVATIMVSAFFVTAFVVGIVYKIVEKWNTPI